MPAKKLNLVPGSVWTVEQLLHGLLMPSANDVALALAEGAGAGSAEAFSGPLQQVATELGMTDNPTLVDPSGLDDAYSVNGGNYISAHDLAIAGRALLSDPFLAQIVSTQSFSFVDPTGLERRLVNGNKMLANYPGAVGVKTGYTRAAGRTLMTAATRDNRTILTVVLNAPDMYGLSTLLLDNGFATPSGVNAGAEFLPPIPLSYRPIGARLATWPGLVGAATAQPVATTTVPPTTAATAVTTAVAAAADVATDSTGATSPQSDTPEVVGANADAGSDALPQWLRVVAVVLVVVLSLRLRVLLLRRRRRHKRAHIAIDRKIDSDEAATRRHVRRASVPVHDTINSRSTPPTPAAPEVHEERIDESSVVVVVDGVDDPAAFEVAPTYRRTSIRAPRR
jgi:D-alanyl-D-alanine carboxypeptidase